MNSETNSRSRQSHSLKTERVVETDEKIFNPEENEAVSPKKYLPNSKKNLKEFKKQASKIEFNPLGSRENYPGNYDNYLQMTLSHISQMRNLRFDYALEDKKIFKGVPDFSKNSNNRKKVLLLDLDETLIHADFNLEFLNDKSNRYDTVVTFKEKSLIMKKIVKKIVMKEEE